MSTPSTFGYRLTQEMTPLGGKNAPIQPPSYSGGEFAVSEAKDGSKSVIINNIGAEAHAMSDAMHAALGDDAPGIFVDIIDEKALDKEIKKAYTNAEKTGTNGSSLEVFSELVLRRINEYPINTWTTSHRQVDALIRYSADPETGKQLWADLDSPISSLIRTAGNGMALAENFPNSALLGYWLSSRSPDWRKVPRSLRSIITGYGAEEVNAGAGKIGDILSGITKENNSVKINKDGGITLAKSGEEPSKANLGSLPSDVKTALFRCDTIKREAVLSTRGLTHHLNVSDEMRNLLQALGIVSAVRGSDKGIYRSGCDLIVTDTLLEEVDSMGNTKEVDAQKTVDDALQVIEDNKHLLAAPIHTAMSSQIISLVVSLVAGQMTSKNKDD